VSFSNKVALASFSVVDYKYPAIFKNFNAALWVAYNKSLSTKYNVAGFR
jgi:hypothetical protein